MLILPRRLVKVVEDKLNHPLAVARSSARRRDREVASGDTGSNKATNLQVVSAVNLVHAISVIKGANVMLMVTEEEKDKGQRKVKICFLRHELRGIISYNNIT
jgi:hypothetical protein